MKKLFLAFRFLTIVPLPSSSKDVTDKDLGASTGYFPVVGALQGGLLYCLFVLLNKIFPLDLTAGLLIGLYILTNGGFHLDGLSDTFDALASRKGRERMLEIMKDSTTGPIGVIAVVMIVFLKYLSLKDVLALDLHPAMPLLLFPVIGKWLMVLAMYQGQSAATSGLGKMFIDNTGFKEMFFSSFLVMLIVLATTSGVYGKAADMQEVSLLLVPLGSVWFLSIISVLFFRKKLGGMTGDNVGAIAEVGEVVFLLMLLAVYAK